MNVRISAKQVFLSIAILTLLSLNGKTFAQASYKYYIPIPEQQLNTAFKIIYPSAGNTMVSVIVITCSESNTIIYYDEWEDGYEANPLSPAQPTTKIWGDNDPANGIPPGYATDVFDEGDQIYLRNDVALPRNPSVLRYDGRDKVVSTHSVTIGKAGWATSPGTVLASAVEVYDSFLFDTEFRLPIGENTPYSNSMFELTTILVMASENNTVVEIDANADGTFEINQTINQGESYMVSSATVGDVREGARVKASKPVQMNIVTGDIRSTYESRTFAGYPVDLWGNNYYNAICQTSASAEVYAILYNPNNFAITVNWTSTSTTGNFNIDPNSTYRHIMPYNSGVHFNSVNKFFGIGVNDADASNNQTYDYGFSLLPESYLTTSVIVGIGPGSSGTPPTVNGSPVWVMSVLPTTVYVDYDNNSDTGPLTDPNGNKYNVSYSLNAYQSLRIYDPDNDQTGLHAYTLDGTRIMAMWGEDPSVAGSGNPYLDMGTTVVPDRTVEIFKTAVISIDGGTPGVVDVGDEVTYQITVRNLTLRSKEVTLLKDTIPTGFSYLANSTVWDSYAVPDNSTGTAFPLDEAGFYMGIVGPNVTNNISFKVIAGEQIKAEPSVTNEVWVESNLGETWKASKTLPVNQGTGITACVLDFVDGSGNVVGVYQPDSPVCVRITDGDRNVRPGITDTITVVVSNTAVND